MIRTNEINNIARLNWRDLSRRDWLPLHWDAYIAEAEKMVRHAQREPHRFCIDDYAALLARRQKERFDFKRGFA